MDVMTMSAQPKHNQYSAIYYNITGFNSKSLIAIQHRNLLARLFAEVI